MTNKRLTIGKLQLRATDGLILAALAFFSVLALIFYYRIDGWWMLVLKNLAVAAVYILFNQFSEHATKKFWKFFLRMAAVVLAYAYLFGAVDKFQLLIQGRWMDDYVLDFEQWTFGVQPTLWLEDFISKPLTEWMMFSYVIYVPMYPVLCGIIYYLRGELAMEDYFFTLGFTNILCDIGFILFPVASPMYYIKQLYTVPLDGWMWTFLGECMLSICILPAVQSRVRTQLPRRSCGLWHTAIIVHHLDFVAHCIIALCLYLLLSLSLCNGRCGWNTGCISCACRRTDIDEDVGYNSSAQGLFCLLDR